MVLLNLIGLAAVLPATPQPFAMQLLGNACGDTVTVCIDGKVESTFAGKLSFRDGNRQWLSVCADVRSPVRNGQIYGVVALGSSKVGGNVALAGNIVARYFDAAQTPDQCAGLQLAVWKALEDGTRWADFGSGHFQARASLAVIAIAQDYYKAIDLAGNATFLSTGAAAAAAAQGAGGQGGGAGGAGQGGGGGGQDQLSD